MDTTDDQEVNCVFCGKLFGSIEQIQDHISLCHDPSNSTNNNSEIQQHSEITSSDNAQESSVNDLKSNFKVYDLNTELIVSKIIDYNTIVQCYKCELYFINNYAARVHFERNHTPNKDNNSRKRKLNGQPRSKKDPSNPRVGYTQRKSHRCPHCSTIFINKEAYKRHVILHQQNSIPFQCQICNMKFSRLKKLKKHQLNDCSKSHCISIVDLKIKNEMDFKSTDMINGASIDKSSEKMTNGFNGNGNISLKIENFNPKDLKFAEKFLENSAIILNKGSQCVCNLCQSCFYSNQSVLKHLVVYHRISPQDGTHPLDDSAVVTTTSAHYLSPNNSPSLNHIAHKLSNLSTNILPKQKHFTSTFPVPPPPPPPDLLTLNFIQSCQLCNSQFASKKGLHRHMITVHPQEQAAGITKRTRCLQCKKRFRNLALLQQHQQFYHHSNVTTTTSSIGNLPPLLALPPLEEKPDFSMLNSSSISAVNSTPVITSVCGSPDNKRYSTPSSSSGPLYSNPSFKKAKVPPNADGLFECDVCNKAFTCRSSLSNHVKSHFNFKNKPFSCGACQQGFMSTLTLQHHRDYLCPNLKRQGGSDDSDQTTHCTNPSEAAGFNNKLSVSSTPPALISNNFNGVSQVVHTTNGGHRVTSGSSNTASSTTASANSLATTRATSCMHCSAMFPDRSLLEDHASKEHSNQAGEVVCILCPRSFTTYMAFRVHMTKSHGGPNGTSLKSALNAAAAAAMASSNHSQLQQQQQLQQSMEMGNVVVDAVCDEDDSSSSGSSISSSQLAIGQSNLNGSSGGNNSVGLLGNSHVTTIGATGRIYNTRHACPNCDKDFSTSQALGNHKRACMPHMYSKKLPN